MLDLSNGSSKDIEPIGSTASLRSIARARHIAIGDWLSLVDIEGVVTVCVRNPESVSVHFNYVLQQT
jgi:hypothetical protein